MGALFDSKSIRRAVEEDKTLIQRTRKKKAPSKNKNGGGISANISQINAQVTQYLGKFKELYTCVYTDNEEDLVRCIDLCIEYGMCAIDTETTGLNPLVDKIVGFSIYAPNCNAYYVPLNHVSYVTGIKIKNQPSFDFAREQIQRLVDASVKIIMFNAPFDERVLKNQLGIKVTCYWDCSLASRLMNENEPQKKLKPLYKKYILKGEEDAFKFDELFHTMGFDKVPIETGYLYAAHDARVTFDFFEYQSKYLYYDETQPFEARNGMNGVSWVFFNIEMPIVDVVVELEDTGVELDLEYCEHLKEVYSKKLEDVKNKAYKEISMYQKEIDSYIGDTKLDNPINLDSPKQLAVLLYDIMQVDVVDKNKKRGTGEDILEKIDSPITKAILEYRAIEKLMNTYIDKLPKCVHKADGRIHCKFNQYGADTGRFSSSEPNLQNIPSHNKDIRKMFKATDGYVMMSADFSQQEIKGMAQMCHDEGMIKAFNEGKDFYAAIASVAFGYDYEDCLEFRPDGTTNPAGKERRGQAKSILLGINYGRGAASIAEQLGCSKKKAEKIKNDVFEGFPAIEEFERQSVEMAETLGYVTTLWGRKRRLPILTHDDYEFEWAQGANLSDDPLDFDDENEDIEDEVPEKLMRKYVSKLRNARWDPPKKAGIIKEAKERDGLIITDNSKARSDAMRQVVNSRIQGTAADQSKLAMIALYNDERLRELGFRMLIPVHDEVIAECPKENAKEVAERFAYLMSNSGGDMFEIPISVDVEITDRWYGEKVEI